jgi:archaellum component FlaC
MAEILSDYTQSLVKDMDKEAGTRFSLSISEAINNLDKYATRPNIGVTISNMKEYANKYIDNALGSVSKEAKDMEDDLSRADSITRQLTQNISMQAKQHEVPIIKPFNVARDISKEETIEIDSIDDQTIKLMERLALRSDMIADFSYKFKEKAVGSWLFSGAKNYVVNVHVPQNEAMNLELAREELNGVFDAASHYVSG